MRKTIDTEALTVKWKARNLAPFQVLKATTVNHRPHPFVIGPLHVAYASDHCGGILGANVCERIPCAHCKRPLSEHTHDTVLFLQLTKHATNAEATAVLQPIGKELEADGIDGISLVETPEQFRIAKG